MLKKHIILIISLFSISHFSCLEKIDLELEKGLERSFFIEGKLIKGDPSLVFVEVSRIFDFTGASVEIVNLRSATLLDEENNSIDLGEQTQAGLYFRFIGADNPDIQIEEGKKYRLSITTFDNQVYESELETLLTAPKVKSVSSEIETRSIVDNLQLGTYKNQDYFNFKIQSELSPSNGTENVNLKWEFVQTLKTTFYNISQPDYILKELIDPINLTEVPILNGDLFERGANLLGYNIFDMPIDSRFSEGYNLTVHQQALSPVAYQFYNQSNNLLNREGNMFDITPGNV